MTANARPFAFTPDALARRWRPRIAFSGLAGLFLLILLAGSGVRRYLRSGHVAPVAAMAGSSGGSRTALAWTDRFGDGTADFLRLSDPADQAVFRRWFTLIAEYQAVRPRSEVPAEITDCASLLRYAYREALKRHDENWFMESGMEVAAPPGEIRAWSYPHTPLGTALFRVRPGAFEAEDASDGAFAEFADAKTLVERNAYLVSRDVWQALPGDLLFYRQFGQSSPWHSMIVTHRAPTLPSFMTLGPITATQANCGAWRWPELLDHPEPQWRPVARQS